MLDVRITATVRAIAQALLVLRPYLLVKDEILNPLILFKFLKNNCTIHPVLRVVSQINSKAGVVIAVGTQLEMCR
jgi:hypothetical protein